MRLTLVRMANVFVLRAIQCIVFVKYVPEAHRNPSIVPSPDVDCWRSTGAAEHRCQWIENGITPRLPFDGRQGFVVCRSTAYADIVCSRGTKKPSSVRRLQRRTEIAVTHPFNHPLYVFTVFGVIKGIIFVANGCGRRWELRQSWATDI